MKKIELTQNKYTLVDDEDYEYLNQFRWCVTARYATRGKWMGREKTQKTILMHRVIMDCPDGMDVDHKDSNGLNNQKENLRICTTSQNLANSKLSKNNSSGFKGVSWHKNRNKWVAQIRINGKLIHLGIFTDINDAKSSYIKAAKKMFGEFYSDGVNFVFDKPRET